MQKLVFLFVCCFALSAPGYGQEYPRKTEIFGGYSYFSASPKSDQISSQTFNRRVGQHGFGTQLAYNLTTKFGVVADFNHHSADTNVAGVKTDTSTVTFLFGPQFSARSEGLRAFGHVLFGGARRRAGSSNSSRLDVDVSSTDLALAAGGGLDISAGRRFSVRLFQFDYIPTRGRDNTPNVGSRWSQNFRLQVGFVIGFGYTK